MSIIAAVVLPSKLSELLELAVRDALTCEAEPARYRLDMGSWHSPGRDGVCHVCLAGAVLAQTLGVPAGKWVTWDSVEDQAELVAINEMRIGSFSDAAICLGLAHDDLALEEASELVRENLPNLGDEGDEAPDYRAPWETYLRAASVLREAGL